MDKNPGYTETLRRVVRPKWETFQGKLAGPGASRLGG